MRLVIAAALTTIALAAYAGGVAPPHTGRNDANPAGGGLVAQAEAETSLFGIVLSKPFAGMAECAVRPDFLEPKLLGYAIPAPAERPCYQRGMHSPLIGSGVPLGSEFIIVRWPASMAPRMTKHGQATVQLIDGVVHSVFVETSGMAAQTQDLEDLTAKFGEPSTRRMVPMQNQMGAKYEVITAAWMRPGGISVLYLGAEGRIARGTLTAATSQAREQQKRAKDASRKNEQKL